MGVACHATSLLNWLYLKIKQIEETDFLLVDIHLQKFWSKIHWVSMVKNGCGQPGQGTLKLAVFSMLVFGMLVQIQETYKLIQWFLGGPGQRS